MKNGRRRIRWKEGSSIVSVIVSFAVLLLTVALFYGAVSFSMKLVDRAVDIRRSTDQLTEDFYKATAGQTNSSGTEVSITLTGSGSSTITPIKMKEATYSAQGVAEGKQLVYFEPAGE